MTALAGFYKDPTLGFVFTGIVMAVLIAWVVWIAVINFGPAAKRRAAEADERRASSPPPTPPAPLT